MGIVDDLALQLLVPSYCSFIFRAPDASLETHPRSTAFVEATHPQSFERVDQFCRAAVWAEFGLSHGAINKRYVEGVSHFWAGLGLG